MHLHPTSNKAVWTSKDHSFSKDSRGGLCHKEPRPNLPSRPSHFQPLFTHVDPDRIPPLSCAQPGASPLLPGAWGKCRPSDPVPNSPRSQPNGYPGGLKTQHWPGRCCFSPGKTWAGTPITDCVLLPLSSLPEVLRHPSVEADTQSTA